MNTLNLVLWVVAGVEGISYLWYSSHVSNRFKLFTQPFAFVLGAVLMWMAYDNGWWFMTCAIIYTLSSVVSMVCAYKLVRLEAKENAQ